MKLKSGYGYWDTTIYPIGGCFKRAFDDGKLIKRVIREIKPPYKGCDIEVEFEDGTCGVTHTDFIER